MITVQVVGRIGRDLSVKELGSGKKVLNFSVASSEGKEKTTWIEVMAWEKTAELISKFFTKGDMIALSGYLQDNSYEKNGVTVKGLKMVASQFAFCGAKNSGKNESEKEEANTEDVIPF